MATRKGHDVVKAYVGQTRARKLVARLERHGVGEMTVRGEWPPRRWPWAYDNGAFRDFTAGESFDTATFEHELIRLSFATRTPMPDFVALPDVVADARATLELAPRWIERIRALLFPRTAPFALVLQNGMDSRDVEPLVGDVSVLFVGGTTEWKWETAPRWREYAHARGLRLHVGRVGTPSLVARARAIGADSIDSCFPLWTSDRLDEFFAALASQQSLFGGAS